MREVDATDAALATAARDENAVNAAAIARAAPVLLAVIDRSLHMRWCNDPWSSFTGVPQTELLGDGWIAVTDPDDVATLGPLVEKRGPFTLDVRVRNHDGRYRWTAMRGAPHGDEMIISAVDVQTSRDAQRTLELLMRVDDALKASFEIEETLERVGRILVEEIADYCSIAILDDNSRLTRATIVHRDRDTEAELRRAFLAPIEFDGPSALARVSRTGNVLYRPIVDAPGPDEPYPVPPALAATPRSLICAPLRTPEGVIGAVALVSSHPYGPDAVDRAQDIAQRCAAAVDNAVLYRRSEEARARLSLLAHLGEELAATVEMDTVLQTLVRRVVPLFADGAIVALLDDDGTLLRRRAFRHFDPAVEEKFRRTVYDSPIPVRSPDPPARAARTTQPVLIEHYDRYPPKRRRRSPFAAAASVLEPTSVLSVPLVARGETLGVLTFAMTSEDRRYTASDLPLALDIARRGALAIERARAFAHERRIAEALQHSMLPDALPDVPSVSLCARYVPGGKAAVGGDWYDVVPLPGARYGVAIGDVAGHGVRAATVMGQLRYALRAFAADGHDPAAVLARLNRYVFEQGPLDLATICYGVLDPTHGGLDLAAAGHLPPLLMRPGRPAELVDLAHAPPIGADPLTQYATTHVDLDAGTTLFLYTDGLVERRGESLDVGLARMLHSSRLVPPLLEDACDHVIHRLLGASAPADDVAVLGLRYAGRSIGHFRVRRPARAAELAPVRRMLSAWLESSGVAPEDIGSVTVAVSEAATNAIEHAYGPGEGWFEVDAEVDDERALTLTVRDAGRWRPKARGGGGRGLPLIGRLMDEFEIRHETSGTEVWMRRRPRGEQHGHG